MKFDWNKWNLPFCRKTCSTTTMTTDWYSIGHRARDRKTTTWTTWTRTTSWARWRVTANESSTRGWRKFMSPEWVSREHAKEKRNSCRHFAIFLSAALFSLFPTSSHFSALLRFKPGLLVWTKAKAKNIDFHRIMSERALCGCQTKFMLAHFNKFPSFIGQHFCAPSRNVWNHCQIHVQCTCLRMNATASGFSGCRRNA